MTESPTYRRFETCPKCQGPMSARQAHPAPVLLQILFGLNFLVLVLGWNHLRLPQWGMLSWTAVTAILGFLLLRARRRASQVILVCIRCGTPVPS